MANLTVYYFSLLLFLLSLLHAHASYGGLCPKKSYCPANSNCSDDRSLCKVGVCPPTGNLLDNCEEDLITIQFSTSAYDVNENSGTAQPVLQLDPALECCSVSVLIKIEDFTRDCTKGIDLVFVLDTSDSITGKTFQLMQRIVEDITRTLDIGSDDSLIGVILFSTDAIVAFDVTTYNVKATLLDAVRILNYNRGDTNTANALTLLHKASQPGGGLKLRNGHSHIAIVMTDGESTNTDATIAAANRLHDSDIYHQVYAVGVNIIPGGNRELAAIANPTSLVFQTSFDPAEIQRLVQRLIYKLSDCTGPLDYVVPRDPEVGYIKVIIPAGATTVSFDVNILDDRRVEDDEIIGVTIYDLSLPYGFVLGRFSSANITITDNDVTTVMFSKPVFSFYENEGLAKPELALSEPAPFDISVTVESFNLNFSSTCDSFQPGEYQVTFLCGLTSAVIPIAIIDDDVFESNETFNVVIDAVTAEPSQYNTDVSIGVPRRATVVIKNDEEPIMARFDKSEYRVHEHVGEITPKMVLSKPSPCCLTVLAELMGVTAEGKAIDFGYATPKIYNYTFLAGSTCAYPDINVTITDDMILEDEEYFEISIIRLVLPFGVEAGNPAKIFINDNDNGVRFAKDFYTVREQGGSVWVQLVLTTPAKGQQMVQLVTTPGTAIGGLDYDAGPYDVTFIPRETSKYFPIRIINDKLYEGTENFTVTIYTLSKDMVRSKPYIATVEISDDEYIVCFKETSYYVDEGRSVRLELQLTPPLSYDIRVTLNYDNIHPTTTSDYSATKGPITFRAGSTIQLITVTARQDSTLEDKYETFIVNATAPSVPSNNPYCDTTVYIVDDDECKIRFHDSSPFYYINKNNPKQPKLRLTCTFPLPFDFSVTIGQFDITAQGGVDYKIEGFRNTAYFTADGRSRTLYSDPFVVEPIDDDLVETDESFDLRVINGSLPSHGLNRVVAIYPSFARFYILNDDECYVTVLKDNLLEFSREIDYSTEVTAYYTTGNSDTKTLQRRDKQLQFDSVRKLRSIKIAPDCRLYRNRNRSSLFRASISYLVSWNHC